MLDNMYIKTPKQMQKCLSIVFLCRAWRLPSVSYFLVLLVHGVLHGVAEGFYPIFLVDELRVTEEWYGRPEI